MEFIVGEEITDLAVKRRSTAHSLPVAAVMIALSQHVHGFAPEVDLTAEEWMAASRNDGSIETTHLRADSDFVAQKR